MTAAERNDFAKAVSSALRRPTDATGRGMSCAFADPTRPMSSLQNERIPAGSVQAASPNQVDTILAIWNEHLEVARELPRLADDVAATVDLIANSMRGGGLLMLAGNGGSAADAQHIAAELTGRFLRDRRALRAMALHANGSALTAIANDYGYDDVFARELSAHARPGDVLVVISTSGNSPNILRAIEVAREYGVLVVGMTGASGGRMRDLCDRCLCVPSERTARIQEMHITIAHTLCQLLEERLC